MQHKRLLFTVVLMCCCFLFGGCGKDEKLMDKVEQSINTELIQTNVENTVEQAQTAYKAGVKDLPELAYNLCISMKRWAPLLMLASFIAGIVVYDSFKKNKEIQKWALTMLIFKVPAIIFVVVYVFSFLYGMFNL